jgi:hypothetical protein
MDGTSGADPSRVNGTRPVLGLDRSRRMHELVVLSLKFDYKQAVAAWAETTSRAPPVIVASDTFETLSRPMA